MVHNGEVTDTGEMTEPTVDRAGEALLESPSTTTTMVHAGSRTETEWWRTAVVYEPTCTDLTECTTDTVEADVKLASRLGADAVLVRPEGGPDEVGEIAHTLLRRSRQLGIRVLVAARDFSFRSWLAAGADGVEVGDAFATNPDTLPGQVHADVAELTEDGIVVATAPTRRRDELADQLQESWPHHLRDARLARAAWSAPALREIIADAYTQRDRVGSAAAWTLHDPRREAAPDNLAATDARFRAAAVLMLALPGAVYVRQGEEVGIAGGAATDEVVARVAEQRGSSGSTYETFRQALRLRRERSLGRGALGVVTGLAVAPEGRALALLNRHVLVIVNTGADDLALPEGTDVVHTSQGLTPIAGAGLAVPPDTTVWIDMS